MARAAELSSLGLRGLLQNADSLVKLGSHQLSLSRQRLGQAMRLLDAGIARGRSALAWGGPATTPYRLPVFNPLGSETGMTLLRRRLMTARSLSDDAPSADEGRAAHGHSRGGEQVSAPLLIVDRARKTFGGLVAVNDVSFKVEKGELLGLIGPNGSGKTTVLNLISGSLSPTSGEIRLAASPSGACPRTRSRGAGSPEPFSSCAFCRRWTHWRTSSPVPCSGIAGCGVTKPSASRATCLPPSASRAARRCPSWR